MFQHVRPGTYNAHMPTEHVEKLREFIKAGLAEKLAGFCQPAVVFGGHFFVGLIIHLHAPELEAPEFFIALSATLLGKKYRAF